ncbi:hypothetical protein COY48_03900 [Candidatus Collierbacteria bacterium CG_4_10_14_0_8_um_filter_43_86]|uniref:Uncharacterized protein n=1 Tax=Candidatus Collierbacteria bacterium CG_4_9_14_3_um_filter_43_16 TaxID=1974532 RepID=A0A2M8BX60_9BACT|nr:MAG: hypothetical protein COY48_03900 [Candidatus Collierbacteria bacterium CG_4_10_14_0_8_um_filter_43_86]PJB48372.1 MAG: hypothetical protein CO104_01450 [Candidatus Collierbacteria bacterium CG_4_9_14_3_um_filter_43_16]
MNDSLLRPMMRVAADENDLFKKVQGRVVVVPRSQNPDWLEKTEISIGQEIERVERYIEEGEKPLLRTRKAIQTGSYFGAEDVEEMGPEALFRLQNTLLHFQMARKRYRYRLHPEFLSWVRQDGLPRFMTLTWDSPDFSISVTPDPSGDSPQHKFDIRPYLHPDLAVQYVGAVKTLLKLAQVSRSSSVGISARFAGSIPLTTKRKMEKALESGLFDTDHLYIASIGPDVWSMQKTPRVKKDPIVFGGVAGPGNVYQFYMIDIFDPTSIEKAAAEMYLHDFPGRA